MNDDRDFLIRLRPLRSDAPAVVRLRRLLKAALRSFDLRCVSAIEVPHDAPLADVQAVDGAAGDRL